VSASGGTGTGYTYSWQYVSGDTAIIVNSGSSNTTGWSRTIPAGAWTFTALWKCVVTDSGGNVGEVAVNVTFTRFSNQ